MIFERDQQFQYHQYLLASVFFFGCVLAFAGQSLPLFSDNKYQQIKSQHGTHIAERLDDWQALVDNNKYSSDREKLKLVNDFFNDYIHWTEDITLWNKKDYWATPLESLIKGAGDCEDFSIAKYYTLQALGVSIDKLKITYVKAIEYNQAHMVLTYYETTNAEPLILDNINKNILKGSQRSDLSPVFSFNGEGLWIANENKFEKQSSSHRIRLWTDLVTRISNELK